MGITWNNEADAKLLIAIIKTSKPKIDHEEVAKYMGKDCTAYAVQHRIRKIQAIAKGADGKESTGPSTPVKTRTPKSVRSTPRSAVKKRKLEAEEDLEDTDGSDSDEEHHLKKKILKDDNTYA